MVNKSSLHATTPLRLIIKKLGLLDGRHRSGPSPKNPKSKRDTHPPRTLPNPNHMGSGRRQYREESGVSVELETPRLWLRRWNDTDRELFAQMNADPRVMQYFPATLSRGESDQLAERIANALKQRGWGLYAAELRGSNEF